MEGPVQRLEGQVGGHLWDEGKVGLLQSGSCVLKPLEGERGVRERTFYECEQQTSGVVPKCFGVRTVDDVQHLVLEDVRANMTAACVMDLKVGQRCYSPFQGPEKVQSELSKYALQEKIGFRCAGLRVEGLGTNAVKRDRKWGRAIREDNVGDLFDEFFRSATHNKHPLLFAAMETVRQLQHMEETIAKYWKWQIYAASVLLVRDAAREDEEWSQIDDEEKARRAAKGPGVRAVLVDFSYAFPYENVGHDNLLFGVRKLREAVSSWASRCVLPARHTTLLFLLRNNGQEILLARKKRGMGTGKFNGVGGKVEEGESELDACVRECSEEVLVHVDRASVRARGVIEFRFVHPVKSKSWDNECYIFTANYEDRFGQPTETDEMAPAWFPVSKIPFESMWQDDSIWMPRLLAGHNVHFRFWFDAQTDGIIAYEERN